MNRRLLRQKILQILFQVDIQKDDYQQIIQMFLNDEENKDVDGEYIKEIVTSILKHLDQIDSYISRFLKEWKLERLANVDRAILRIAAFEMLYQPAIPIKVSVNEAVELAKIFGSNESPKFINGVLGAMIKANPEWEEKKLKGEDQKV